VPDFSFCFSLSTFLILSRSLYFVPRTTHATTHNPIAHASWPSPPYPPSPLVALVSCSNPLKTLPCTLEFSFCFFSQALRSSVWLPHKTSYLHLTRNRAPPYLTSLTCISDLTLLPFPARHTRLDCTFKMSFLQGLGLRPKKVPFLFPLLCCVVSAVPPIPTNPPAPCTPLFSSPIPLKFLLCTIPNPPFFSFCI
jgi:hypothetical protein